MNAHKRLQFLLWISASLLLSACTAPYEVPVLSARPEGIMDFPGISQLVTAHKRLDVLMVHGMCTKHDTWAKESILALHREMGASGAPTIQEVAVEGSRAKVFWSTFPVPGGEVQARALLWSPIVEPLKTQVCYDQSTKSALCEAAPPTTNPLYPYTRARVNKQIKDTLLNDCLADALIYQGRSRDSIVAEIQRGIHTLPEALLSRSGHVDIFRAAATETTPLVLVTDSLGSKITFDAIYQLTRNHDAARKEAGMQTALRTTQVFMRANQLPILALADQVIPSATSAQNDGNGYPPDPLGALLEMRRQLPSVRDALPPRVVAFTDPNDLLSYSLKNAHVDPKRPYDVVDVIVSNSNTYAWFLENPVSAHTDYDLNSAVMRLIVCGNPKTGCVTP